MVKATRRSMYGVGAGNIISSSSRRYTDNPEGGGGIDRRNYPIHDPIYSSSREQTVIFPVVEESVYEDGVNPRLLRIQQQQRVGSSPRSCRTWCLVCLIAFGSLAIITTTAVLVRKKRASSNNNAIINNNEQSQLVPPPVNLASLCSGESGSLAQCIQACKAAECCNNNDTATKSLGSCNDHPLCIEYTPCPNHHPTDETISNVENAQAENKTYPDDADDISHGEETIIDSNESESQEIQDMTKTVDQNKTNDTVDQDILPNVTLNDTLPEVETNEEKEATIMPSNNTIVSTPEELISNEEPNDPVLDPELESVSSVEVAGDNDEEQIPTTNAKPAVMDIGTRCASENIQTKKGREACEERCIQGMCCFVPGMGPCDQPMVCSGYEVCYGLISGKGNRWMMATAEQEKPTKHLRSV